MNKTVLSTKKLSRSQQELLLNSGIGLVQRDFISIIPLQFKLKEIPKNVIFTSKNAVKAMLSHPGLSEFKTRNIFCVGEKTADFLKQNGFQVVETAHYGADLAEKIVQKHENGEFLFLCGKKRNPELSATLKKEKVKLTEVEIYDTQANPGKIDRNFDGVLFFSPSAVKSFCSENALFGTPAFCIGKTTAAEARKHTDKVIIANKPSIENVVVQVVKKLK